MSWELLALVVLTVALVAVCTVLLHLLRERGGMIRGAELNEQLTAWLRDGEERHRAVVDSLVDGVIAIDAKGTIVSFNKAAEGIFGYRASDVVGKNVSCLMPEPYRGEHDGYVQRFLITREPRVIGKGRELLGLRHDGSTFPLELAVSECRIRGEVSFVGIVRDISERKRAEAALIEAREEAEAASRAKSDFLATMSHEIRTPMNGVLGLAQVLRKTALNETQRQYVNLVYESGRSLLTILNDLLDFSKIDAGRLRIEPEPFCLQDTVQHVCHLLEQTAADKGVHVLVESSSNCPMYLLGDVGRIRQVLLNLVGNAVKFTERGSVRVLTRCAERRDGHVTVHIQVVDTGIGMSAQTVSRLFEPFMQADASTTRRFGGTGLGLVICRRLIGLMGGDIAVESELGKGSTFSLTLTLPICEAPAVALADTTGQLVGNILLVEDVDINREVAIALLSDLGVAVATANDGREAVERWASGAFDLVLMDCQMPGMDGYEATRVIRLIEADGRPRTPVIALTANALADDRERCLASGMDDHLAKPFTQDELRQKLGRWLRRTPGAMPMSSPAAQPALHNSAAGDSFDPSRLAALRNAMSPADYAHLVPTYLKSAEDLMRQMPAAAANKDVALLRRLAHSLKSASQSVGAVGLGKLAAELEARCKAGDLSDAEQRVDVIVAQLPSVAHALLALPASRAPAVQPS